MREDKTFGERNRLSPVDRTIKKYFLVFEGTDTEKIYFKAVGEEKIKLGINPIIELIPIERYYSEDGWSNPKKILDRLLLDIEESKTDTISYETLLNRIMDNILKNSPSTSKTTLKDIWNFLELICCDELSKELNDTVEEIEKNCSILLEKYKEKFDTKEICWDISEVLQIKGLTYSSDIDKICLIVDRDKKSFFSTPENNQYAYVLEKCKDNNIGFYLTNPCFEFWLLLHFDEVFNLDKEHLIENIDVTTKCKYAEHNLKALFKNNYQKNFKKSNYNAHFFISNIDKAIENEKKFCEDINQLECKLGSNVGTLITELRTI